MIHVPVFFSFHPIATMPACLPPPLPSAPFCFQQTQPAAPVGPSAALFQTAFFYYLFFVGPVFAGLWVWLMKVFRDSFGTWVEGVITLCFWSFFWTTTILLIACFKGTDDTGIFMITALNFLATGSVKHAFDFSGLVKAAGMKAAEIGEKMGKAAASGK